MWKKKLGDRMIKQLLTRLSQNIAICQWQSDRLSQLVGLLATGKSVIVFNLAQ